MYMWLLHSDRLKGILATWGYGKISALVYMIGLALLPILASQSMVIDSTVSSAFKAIAYITPSQKLKHVILSAILPLSGIITAILVYTAINLLAQATPRRFALRLFSTKYLFLDLDRDGVLSGKDIKEGVGRISAGLLQCICATYSCLFFIRCKRCPPYYHPKREGGLFDKFWSALSNQNGPVVILNLFLNCVACFLTVARWLALFGIDPAAVFAFGTAGTVALSFALQKLVANAFAGLLIYVTSPISVGDFIETSDVLGTVVKIGWTHTVVQASNGLVVNIPNTLLSEEKTKNWSSERCEKVQVLIELPVRFPSHDFKIEGGTQFLASIEDDLSTCELRCSRFMQPPRAYFTKYTQGPEGPVPWILIDAWLANEFQGDPQLYGLKSDITVAALAAIKKQGCQVPGLNAGNIIAI
eukprot:TRINITY_DN23757_c0_g2_i1.p1 TRINITY_DN23757_c0_g2~~TRINITY_DN23757_c0_g2_i1.p1  ORF type:complete len:467 (+),score=55.98 TRINITY_DN23757_c0_g2_i1:159-1403(+)